jgi:cbb3-type cytochrome oxidase maturation protein
MSVIAVMIGASLMLAGGFLLAFLWAVRSGQYDDRVTPSIRMLFDERDPAVRDSNHHLS